MWNPWRHVRIAGSLLVIVSAFIHRLDLTILGLLIHYIGVASGIDLVERRLDALTETKEEK